MAQLFFTIMHCFKEGTHLDEQSRLSSEDFELKNINNEKIQFYDNEKNHIIRFKLTKEFFFISVEYGKTLPRRDKVVNTQGIERDNERKEDEAELQDQLFCLFNFIEDSSYVYISSQNGKGLIKNIIKNKFGIDINIRHTYGNIEEFTKKLSICEEISFTFAEDLLSLNSSIKNGLQDLTGVSSPKKFKIIAKYSTKNSLTGIVKFINNMYAEYKDYNLKSLIVRGKDEDKFETIYNSETFSKKIKNILDKNGEGVYNFDDVYSQLLKEVKNTS